MSDSQPHMPPEWVLTTIEDISVHIASVNPKEKPTIEFDYLDIASIDNKLQKITNPKKYVGKDAPSRARQFVFTGDILFSTVRTYLKNFALVDSFYNGQIASTGFCVIRALSDIDNKFVFYYIQTNQFLNPLNELQRGTSYPAVRDSDVFVQPIPLPPLPEQHRIVNKIEELFTQLDAGVASLKKVQAQLKRYRQAVLKAAFEGRLTQEWREQYKGEIEPADVLIDKIKQERLKKITKNWDPIIDIDESSLPQLPDCWSWAKLGELFQVKPGGTPSRSVMEYWGGSIPWVSSGEVGNCLISETNESITKKGVENSNAKLNPVGTVLLAMIGEGKTRGQTAILTIEAATNQNVAAIRCPDTPISSKYIFYWFLKNYNDNRRKGSGGMQQALNARIISEMVFPLPPLSEQPEIILELDRHFSQIDHIENTITKSLRQAESLRQSILKRAFEGKLVPQDPNDEPASILLERIKAEKARHAAEPKKGKTHQPKSPKRKVPNGN